MNFGIQEFIENVAIRTWTYIFGSEFEENSVDQIELSRDCIYSFMKLLTIQDLKRASRVCKLWHEVAKNNFIFNGFQLKNKFPSFKIKDMHPFSHLFITLAYEKIITDAMLKKLIAIIYKVNGYCMIYLFYGGDKSSCKRCLSRGFQGEWIIDIHRSGKTSEFDVYQCKHDHNTSEWEYNFNEELSKIWKDQNNESEQSKHYQLNVEIKFWEAKKNLNADKATYTCRADNQAYLQGTHQFEFNNSYYHGRCYNDPTYNCNTNDNCNYTNMC